MSGKPQRFVKPLTDQERQRLQRIWKEHDSHRTRCRAHAIILSDRGWSIPQLCDAFQISRNTAAGWLDRWEAEGTEGLGDEPRSGAPPKLDQQEQKHLLDRLRENPHCPRQVIDQTEQETGTRISRRTLRRIAERYRLTWKRTRGSVRDRRDPVEFATSKEEIGEFARMQQSGQIHLWFFDEAGFSLQPPTQYAWQPIGETLRIPSRRGGNISALGFLDLDCQLAPYEVEGTVDSQVVVDVFDHFVSGLREPAVVVLDNSPLHTSARFQGRLSHWADRGLFTYFLPPYSPELNLIEILWREIKHRWLPLEAYRSVASLWDHLGRVLAEVGKTFTIDFASPAAS